MVLNEMLLVLSDAAATAGAAASGEATTATAGIGEMIGMFPLILMFVVFYFMLIRPQRKKDKKVKEMLAALKQV